MQIDFFETDNGMDSRAVGAGVYMVELENKKTKKKICLYVGESVWIASRCGVHLYSLYEDPNYFGLTKGDIENDQFILKFSVVENINGKKSVLGCGKYKELELEAIKANKPLTQLDTSDRQIRNNEKKKLKVQSELLKQGFK
ncbi:hypothetical protein [uncultured Clostridium sp.]|uniref:hypothetical protein n=1 Tax=uncultured Clostridium sp. TaxID=59620 RepID=UPI0025CCF3CA|nr:hypothetical protein [uncultured Clostridium sp.]